MKWWGEMNGWVRWNKTASDKIKCGTKGEEVKEKVKCVMKWEKERRRRRRKRSRRRNEEWSVLFKHRTLMYLQSVAAEWSSRVLASTARETDVLWGFELSGYEHLPLVEGQGGTRRRGCATWGATRGRRKVRVWVRRGFVSFAQTARIPFCVGWSEVGVMGKREREMRRNEVKH